MFELLLNKYPRYEVAIRPDLTLLADYQSTVPAELFQFWNQHGLGVSVDGLVRFVNPRNFEDFVQQHIEVLHAPAYIIAVTAMADIITWEQKYYRLYNLRKNTRHVMFMDTKILNLFLTDETFLEIELSAKQYRAAKKKFGEPAYDECFGYFPALALGGSEKLANIQVVKLLPHLEVLGQLIGKI